MYMYIYIYIYICIFLFDWYNISFCLGSLASIMFSLLHLSNFLYFRTESPSPFRRTSDSGSSVYDIKSVAIRYLHEVLIANIVAALGSFRGLHIMGFVLALLVNFYVNTSTQRYCKVTEQSMNLIRIE